MKTVLALTLLLLTGMTVNAQQQTMHRPVMPGLRSQDIYVAARDNLTTPDTRVVVEGDGNIRALRLSAADYGRYVALEIKVNDARKAYEAAELQRHKMERELAIAYGAIVPPWNDSQPYVNFYTTDPHDEYSLDGPFLIIRSKQQDSVFTINGQYQLTGGIR